MDEPKDQLDAAIDHKFEEVKELLLAREVRNRLSQLTGVTVDVPGLPLQLEAPADKQTAKKKPDRRKAIAKAAKGKKPAKAKGRGGKKSPRRKFTNEFKLKVLAEVDEAETLKEVLDKHDLYPSNIVTWRRHRDQGKLDPDPGSDDNSRSGDPGETASPPTEETLDVVDQLGGGERPPGPFAGAPTREDLADFPSS